MSLRCLGVASVWLVCAVGQASAHGVPPVGAGEARLRAVETEQLGAEHAAAHARQRLLAQRAGPPVPLRAAAAPGDPPDQIGAWAPAVGLPVIAINAALLPTGKILMFAYPHRPGYGDGDFDYADAYVWDPVTGSSKSVPPPQDPATGKPTNIWCAGTSFLADGRVLVAGGNVDDPRTDFHGINRVFTFDPFTETWTVEPRMAQGRWYPSQLLMPNGRTLIIGGLTRPGDRDDSGTNLDLEVFYPEGKIRRVDDFRFADPGRPPATGFYPKLFWLPNGRALAAGPNPQDTWFLDTPRLGQPTTWSDVPDLSVTREWATTVMLDDARIMSLGGSDLDADGDGRRPAMRTTEIFDPARPADGWLAGPALAVARSHANSVLLPDGTVATIGGGYGEDSNQEFYRWLYDAQQTRVELFDPRTGTVNLGPAQAEGRTYHSTALLLPDGRVMSAGDDINGPAGPGSGASSDTAEIYSPPYLFRGPRPRIQSAPAVLDYGSSFVVSTPDAAAVARAVLVAPGAATHDTDMNQRRIELPAPQALAGGVRLSAPASIDAAPPGYYMLFLLTADDVPSIARWVRLPLGPQPPEVEPTPVPTPVAPTPMPAPTATPAPAPRLSVKITPRRLRTLLSTGKLVVALRLNRAGFVSVAASVDLGASRSRVLARTQTIRFTRQGTRRVTLRLTAATRRALRGRRRATVRVRATAKSGGATLRASARLIAR